MLDLEYMCGSCLWCMVLVCIFLKVVVEDGVGVGFWEFRYYSEGMGKVGWLMESVMLRRLYGGFWGLVLLGIY